MSATAARGAAGWLFLSGRLRKTDQGPVELIRRLTHAERAAIALRREREAKERGKR